MCDRRILSSDRQDWDELAAESNSAECFSRRPGERTTDGCVAKFETHNDQGDSSGRADLLAVGSCAA